MAAKRGWAERNRSLMVRFLKGALRANRWLFANKEPAIDFLAKEIQITPELGRKGLGLLHLEPHLASQCRAEPGGDEVCPPDPCRTDEGRAAGSATVRRSQLSATNNQRIRRVVKFT